MKILHLTNVDEAGGTNLNCLQFILASTDTNELVVLDRPGEMHDRWQRAGVAVEYLGILRGRRAGFIRGLQERVGRGRYDVILLWCCIRIPLIRFALRASGARLGIHLGNPRAGGPLRESFLWLQARLLPSALETKLFSCSQHVQASHSGHYWRRFENRVLYNPIALAAELPAARAGRAPTPARLGMVARMDRIKDHATLLRAIALVRARGVAVELELVGDGPLRAELTALIAQLGLGSHVILSGYVDDVPARLKSWTLFVYSTTAQEGLGNAVIEALAAGVPCLVSDLPMMREIDGGDGFMRFFSAGDAADLALQIIATLADAEFRGRVPSLGARSVRRKHDPSAYARNVVEYLTAG